jgi:hypothetical protein
MLLWEDGISRKLDLRNEPDHAGADGDPAAAAPKSELASAAKPAKR